MPHRLQNYKRHLFKVPHYKTDAGLDAECERRKAAGPLPAEPRQRRAEYPSICPQPARAC